MDRPANVRWSPQQYLRYADERSRPFFDLVSRIDAAGARTVADLGCGPGQLTAALTERFVDAQVLGLDSSQDMLAQAASYAGPRLRFELGDVTTWEAAEPYDVVVSNATLQWVDRHDELLGRLVEQVAPGGWFAFQVPGNFTAPSHTQIAEQVRSPHWRGRIDPTVVDRPASFEPEHYLACLRRCGCEVDVWTTTYYHQLSGPAPVFNWVKGTALRPVLAALAADDVAEFEAELIERLARAYPTADGVTTLPFRRIFAVAQRPSTR